MSFDIGRFCQESFKSFPSQDLTFRLKLTLRGSFWSFSAIIFAVLSEYSFWTTFCKLLDHEKTKIDSFALSEE